MKILPLISTTAMAVSLGAAVQAATLDFDAVVRNGALEGLTGSGSITFDETLLSRIGDESISITGDDGSLIDPNLALSLEVGDLIFTEGDDTDFPDFPQFDFTSGILEFVDYVVDDDSTAIDLAALGVINFSFADDLIFNADGSFSVGVDVEYAAEIPLPASMPLFLTALGAGVVLLRRRRRA